MLQVALLLALVTMLGLGTPVSAGPATHPAPVTCACPAGVTVGPGSWVRLPPPNATITAAYLTLNNQSHRNLTVIGAESPVAAAVELHEHRQDAAGVMRMREVASLELPEGGQLIMAPGGLHLMLIGLHSMLTEGLTEGVHVPLILYLAHDEQINLEIPVHRNPPDRPGPGMHHPEHHGHHKHHDHHEHPHTH